MPLPPWWRWKKRPPPPGASPRPPDDAAPLASEGTPNGVDPRVKMLVQRELSKSQTGKPVLSPRLTPWFLGAFTLCSSVTAAAFKFPGLVPDELLFAATVGSIFFGGMLASGPGLRRRR